MHTYALWKNLPSFTNTLWMFLCTFLHYIILTLCTNKLYDDLSCKQVIVCEFINCFVSYVCYNYYVISELLIGYCRRGKICWAKHLQFQPMEVFVEIVFMLLDQKYLIFSVIKKKNLYSQKNLTVVLKTAKIV